MTVEILYVGHSCFLLKVRNYNILIDPFISQNPIASFDANKINISDILVTHGHSDHLGDAIPLSKSTGAMITAIFETATYCCERGAKAQGCNIGGTVEFEWGSTKWLTATHSNSTPNGAYGGCAAGILLNIEGKKIYHAGDTGLTSDLKIVGDYYKPEIVMLPIGGLFTMGIDEAVEATKWLNPKTVIPMHYNTFPAIEADAELFKTRVKAETNAECLIMQINERIVV